MYHQQDPDEIKKGLLQIAYGSARLYGLELNENVKFVVSKFIEEAVENLNMEDLIGDADDDDLNAVARTLVDVMFWVSNEMSSEDISVDSVTRFVHRRERQLNEWKRSEFRGMWPFKGSKKDDW
jgi:phosphoribosyl-ATP pyrophosphohydrolase